LAPLEEVTSVTPCKPNECRCCGGALAGDDLDPYRHQVFEVPELKPSVHEYQLHTLACDRCGITTQGEIPDGVPTGQFGPRLQAMVGVCSGAYRLSKRSIEELLRDFFGVEISLGSIANLEQATSEALAEPVAEVVASIKHAPVVHADETGWYERFANSLYRWARSAADTSSDMGNFIGDGP
jgi:transposase